MHTLVTIELGSSDFGRLNPVEGTEILHKRRVSNGDEINQPEKLGVDLFSEALALFDWVLHPL